MHRALEHGSIGFCVDVDHAFRAVHELHALLRGGVVEGVVELGCFLADLAGVAVGELAVAEGAGNVVDVNGGV